MTAPFGGAKGPIVGRNMFVWQLDRVIKAEGGPIGVVEKAKRAHLCGVWIKIADGTAPYRRNLGDDCTAVREGLTEAGIAVWGWQVPQGKSVALAQDEASVAAELTAAIKAQGVLMDAEAAQGGLFFQGGPDEAAAYGSRLRQLADGAGFAVALCSNDIPQNFPAFPFDGFAASAHVNAPQVYYGGSSSVGSRLRRAIDANAGVGLPFVPVGSAWVGDGGGCASASACAEQAMVFMQLVKQHGFPGYAFWHWLGAPAPLWEVLFSSAV